MKNSQNFIFFILGIVITLSIVFWFNYLNQNIDEENLNIEERTLVEYWEEKEKSTLCAKNLTYSSLSLEDYDTFVYDVLASIFTNDFFYLLKEKNECETFFNKWILDNDSNNECMIKSAFWTVLSGEELDTELKNKLIKDIENFDKVLWLLESKDCSKLVDINSNLAWYCDSKDNFTSEKELIFNESFNLLCE